MSDPFSAKRRFPRIPSEKSLLVKRLGKEEVEGFAKTCVVGLGGCMFLSDERLGNGAHLELLMALRGEVVKAIGKVVYEIPKNESEIEVGVEFVQIDPDDRELLETLFPAVEPTA